MLSNELQGDFALQYLITFLEGIISFISPCMLPLLPLYISYFAGKADKKGHIFLRAGFFVLGFTVVFTALGLFAGTLSSFLAIYGRTINIVCGIIVILFGLSYLEVIRLPFFKGMQGAKEISSIFSAFVKPPQTSSDALPNFFVSKSSLTYALTTLIPATFS